MTSVYDSERLAPADTDHRRVLAVLTFLNGS